MKPADVLKKMLATHESVFNSRTLLVSEITKDKHEQWMKAFHDVEDYVNMLLAKSRSFGKGISTSNKELFEKAIKHIKEEYANVLAMQRLFVAKPDFKPKEAVLQKFNSTVNGLASLQKELSPGILDVADTKGIKNILSKIALALQNTAQRIIEEFKKR